MVGEGSKWAFIFDSQASKFEFLALLNNSMSVLCNVTLADHGLCLKPKWMMSLLVGTGCILSFSKVGPSAKNIGNRCIR